MIGVLRDGSLPWRGQRLDRSASGSTTGSPPDSLRGVPGVAQTESNAGRLRSVNGPLPGRPLLRRGRYLRPGWTRRTRGHPDCFVHRADLVGGVIDGPIDLRPIFHSELPSNGSEWDRAIELGIDVAELERNLTLTPEQRIVQHQRALRLAEAVRAGMARARVG